MRKYAWFAAILALIIYPCAGSAQTATPTIGVSGLPSGILNAASLAADTTNVAAPGSLISIFGKNLATATGTNLTQPPLNLNGTVVQVGSSFAPLLFVSATQINAQVPFEVTPGTTVSVVVWVNGHPSAPVTLRVQTAAPGIFTQGQTGVGPGAVFHDADGTCVGSISPCTPAMAGETIQIRCTGLGVTLASPSLPAVGTGEFGKGQPTLLVPTVTIGGSRASVISAVARQGFVGEFIIKAVVPNALSGDQTLAITAGGSTTRAAVTVSIGAIAPPPPTSGGGGTGTSGTGPLIFSGGILNAASFDPASSDAAAPGGLISIFGNNLATTTTGTGAPPLPLSLSGTSVVIGNVTAPLLLVSPSQINAQVPFEIPPGSTVSVVVTVNGQSSTPESLKIVSAAPGVFTATGSGAGVAVLYHSDGTLVNNASPALPGEEVTILATGLGDTLSTANLPAVKTGEAGNGQLTVVTPNVTIGADASGKGGKDALVTSSSAAPGAVGQYLIKVVLPDVGAGDQSFTITGAGLTSRAAVLRIGFLFPQPPAFLQANLAGSFTANFQLTRSDPGDPAFHEVATFSKTVASPGCSIEIAGTNGPNYTGLVHCQDYSDPNNLVAIIVGLKNGQFADNKLVFTTILDTGINHFFFIGQGKSPSGTVTLTADAPITAAAVSIDFKRPNFAAGDIVIGTLDVSIALSGSSTIPAQTVVVGGGFQDTITFVQR